LISKDKKTFVQWYHNDTVYHQGQNEVVDAEIMEEKWNRELIFLKKMNESYPMHIPLILDIDYLEKKIYLEIDGQDFWEKSNCSLENYNNVLSDWDDQMCDIIKAHKTLGIFKYSMHPSSYFVIDGKLKSINYFFAYDKNEPNFSIKDVESHIYSTRQTEIKKNIKQLGIEWDVPQSFSTMEKLCWFSFKTNYPETFINRVLCLK